MVQVACQFRVQKHDSRRAVYCDKSEQHDVADRARCDWRFRRDEFRAEKILVERLKKNDKVEIKWDSVLDEVLGDEEPLGVTGARLKNVKTGETEDLAVHGVFIAIGHKPSTELFKGKLPMDDEGYLIKHADSTATDIPGVFAAGDVTDKVYRQAVTAAGMGCMAALEAEKYVAELEDA